MVQEHVFAIRSGVSSNSISIQWPRDHIDGLTPQGRRTSAPYSHRRHILLALERVHKDANLVKFNVNQGPSAYIFTEEIVCSMQPHLKLNVYDEHLAAMIVGIYRGSRPATVVPIGNRLHLVVLGPVFSSFTTHFDPHVRE